MQIAEVHPFAQKTCRLLGMEFSFPTRKPPPERYTLLDIPDVLLVASLVVATKHLYPLDGVERFPRDPSDPLCRRMNWTVWESEFAKQPERKPGLLEYEHMDPQEVWSMGREEMNELLNWFQETQIERNGTGKRSGVSAGCASSGLTITKRRGTLNAFSLFTTFNRCPRSPNRCKRTLRQG